MIEINGVQLELTDEDPVYQNLIPEIENEGGYDFEAVEFRPGDVVLDVGAHVGIVSMYLASLHPEIVIHAFEPWPENHARLVRNLRFNGVHNVTPHKLAVSGDGRYLEMVAGSHTAEPSAFYTPNSQERVRVRSTTIPRILARYGIERVRLLKLDCEGAEHEILADSDRWMDRVDHLRGEIHMIPPLREAGYTVDQIRTRFPEGRWMVVEGP